MENVYIDLDSTVFDYQKKFNHHHTLVTGEDKSHINWGNYHTHELYGISYENRYDYLTHKGFFETMEPYEGAFDVIGDLINKYNVYFVTNCVVKEAYAEKHDSLASHLGSSFDISMMITMKDKHLLKAGFVLDDNPSVIESCTLAEHNVLIYDQPWNYGLSGTRVKNWGQIRKILL